MKAKICSWLLASAYLAWGVCLFLFIPRLQGAYLGFGYSPPLLVKIMFIAGPFGCLLIAAMFGAFLVLNTRRFHLRFVSLILTIALLAWAGCFTNVVLTTFTRLNGMTQYH